MSCLKYFRIAAFAAAITLAFGIASNAVAAPPLEKLDWKASGDGLILHDTNTDLKWLNITQTFNRSVNDLMGQFFGNTSILPLTGAFSDFRYATKSEVAQLYADFGIVTIDNTFSTANWTGANVAFQALGISGTNFTVTVQEALSIDSPGVANAPEIVMDGNRARAFVFPTPTLTNFYTFDSKKATLGSYLVMVSSIPEPETYVMMLAGLCIVGCAARHKRRRSA